MGFKFGKAAALGLLVVGLSHCGKTEKVEGVKGPQGDKGQTGDKGPQGDRGEQGAPGSSGNGNYPNPYPSPTPTNNGNSGTNLPPTSPYPPIIIVLPTQQCNRTICPQGTMLVCACIDGAWQTISIGQHDIGKVRIRNYGRCEDYNRNLGANDCIWWPRERPEPTITVTAQPIPIPTVTVTAYPIPYPTVTVFPRPNQC